MSKYLLESQKKLKHNSTEPFSIIEYMVYQDTEEQTRFMLAKCENQSAYTLLEATIEITQYDEDHIELLKAQYTFEDLNVSPFKSIVPQVKIGIEPNCDSIEAHLVHTRSKNKDWKVGRWTELTEDISQPEIPTKHIQIEQIPNQTFKFPLGIVGLFFVVYIILVGAVFFLINN